MEHQTNNQSASLKKRSFCTKCRKFYGKPQTNGYCSVCFKLELQQNAGSLENVASRTISEEKKEKEVTGATEPAKEEQEKEQKPVKPLQKNRKRCFQCNRKTGFLGYECKCSYSFCSKHRHPEDHACDHDFKKAHMEKLRKNNPRCVPRKVAEI